MRLIKKYPYMFLSFLVMLAVSVPANAQLLAGFASGLAGTVIGLFGFSGGLNGDGYCWFCPLYTTLFNTMNELATYIAKELKSTFLMLLGIGVLFWIAFKVGSVVVKTQEVDLMQFIGELFKQLGRAMIAAAFLAGTIQIYHYVVSPFIAYSLALTTSVLHARDMGSITDMVTNLFNVDDAPNITANILGESSVMAFSSEILEQILHILKFVSASLIAGMVIGGIVILCGLADSWLNVLPNPQVTLVGFLIFGAYFGVYLAVPFKLIDAMVRLTFVAALTPVWVILWVFPSTVSYTKNAWEMLLNCCACFICLGVVLCITFNILEYMMPNKGQIITFLLGGLDLLATQEMNLINPSVLITFALGTLATNLVKNSSQIATQIVKSYGTGVGDGLDQAVAKGIGSYGKLGGVIGAAGMSALGGSLKDAMSSVKGITDPLRDKYNPFTKDTAKDAKEDGFITAARKRWTDPENKPSGETPSVAPTAAPTPKP